VKCYICIACRQRSSCGRYITLCGGVLSLTRLGFILIKAVVIATASVAVADDEDLIDVYADSSFLNTLVRDAVLTSFRVCVLFSY
jgi:hypothetical protein